MEEEKKSEEFLRISTKCSIERKFRDDFDEKNNHFHKKNEAEGEAPTKDQTVRSAEMICCLIGICVFVCLFVFQYRNDEFWNGWMDDNNNNIC